MNTTSDFDDVPFVNEECGDTMWDETLLNQLNQTTSSQESTRLRATVEASDPETGKGDDRQNDEQKTE